MIDTWYFGIVSGLIFLTISGLGIALCICICETLGEHVDD